MADAMGAPVAVEWEAVAGLERSALTVMSGAGGGCEAAVQVLMDVLTSAKSGCGGFRRGIKGLGARACCPGVRKGGREACRGAVLLGCGWRK